MEQVQEALNIVNQVVERGVSKGLFTTQELRAIFAATDLLSSQFTTSKDSVEFINQD
jgi:hypothetical protein